MKAILPLLIIAFLIAVFAAPFASSWPDGLERVGHELGFDHFALEDPIIKSPLPDYTVTSLRDLPVSTSIAGAIGTLICFLLPFSLYLIRKK